MLQGSNFIQKDGMHWVAGRKSHKGVCFFSLVGVLQDGRLAMMTVELVEEMEGIQTEETLKN